MILLYLKGRIGNQLFMFAFAEALRQKFGKNEKIIIDDTEVLETNWVDSLLSYNLPNVEFVHTHDLLNSKEFSKQKFWKRVYGRLVRNADYNKKFKIEKLFQRLFNRMGLYVCENGYLKVTKSFAKNKLLEGYFQSEDYFANCKELIKNQFDLSTQLEKYNYPGLEELKKRNSVCISIKVEHNVGSSLFDVCNDGYWEDAIKYITDHVQDPLFFICSDNVDYVKEHLIDCSKYDTICQDKKAPVEISMAAMSCCKHFIIGNTSFGWWAQYLSKKPIEEKIMIAPSKWMKVEMPVDIYQPNWTLIQV